MQHAKNCSKNLQSVKVKEKGEKKRVVQSRLEVGYQSGMSKVFFSRNCIQTISKLKQKNTKS
jgi:hypothetical protein